MKHFLIYTNQIKDKDTTTKKLAEILNVTYDDMKEISSYLEEDLNNRLQYHDKDFKAFSPYCFILTARVSNPRFNKKAE